MTGLLRHWWRTARKNLAAARARKLPAGGKLHVGCGPVHLDGWFNIDNRRYDAVDFVLDVRDGLPFRELRFVFAEHFIEHLPWWECERFLRDCRNALAADGVLRLSTPNLDWVVATQYGAGDPIADCFALNTSFRGWGHQFLYNAKTLEAMLHRVGFASVAFLEYGKSPHRELHGLERHEISPDSIELPHVLVVEASGIGGAANETLQSSADRFLLTLGAS
jgi:predicted SAM-dependent methyltransferase